MNSIRPAKSLVLTHDEHATLGELVEIMGLIESMLIESAERVDSGVAKKIASLPGQRGLWADTVVRRIGNPQMAALVPSAKLQIEKLTEDRNDFIHALFTNDYVDDYVEPGYQTTSATRSKTGSSRPTGDLQSIRDRAAELSCLIDQISRAVQ